MDEAPELTNLLNRFVDGDRNVQNELAERIRSDLRGLAGALLRGRSDHLLQPTALVNEAWMKLAGRSHVHFEGRRAFFVLAAQVMRSVLVDHVRAMGAQKRGGGMERQSLSLLAGQGPPGDAGSGIDLLDFDEALGDLQAKDPELAELVELRVFGGLNHADLARELDVSPSTVDRRWRLARAWLRIRLEG